MVMAVYDCLTYRMVSCRSWLQDASCVFRLFIAHAWVHVLKGGGVVPDHGGADRPGAAGPFTRALTKPLDLAGLPAGGHGVEEVAKNG